MRLQRGPLEPADPILQVPVVPADPEILSNQVVEEVEEAEQAVGSILILRQTFFVWRHSRAVAAKTLKRI